MADIVFSAPLDATVVIDDAGISPDSDFRVKTYDGIDESTVFRVHASGSVRVFGEIRKSQGPIEFRSTDFDGRRPGWAVRIASFDARDLASGSGFAPFAVWGDGTISFAGPGAPPGIVLPVLDSEPADPQAGLIVLYQSGTTTQLRMFDGASWAVFDMV